MATPQGVVVYDGPSMLDGSPILGIVTYESSNSKTGPMAQLWIIRADVDPQAASVAGMDGAVCGGCVHRGRMVLRRVKRRLVSVLVGRSCYVTLWQGPAAVFHAWLRGNYRACQSRGDIERAGAGVNMRLGAYGDPAALPSGVVLPLIRYATGWTGYTHQWRSARFAWLKGIVMASCDSSRDFIRARLAGWGTFTVTPADAAAPSGTELCANSVTGVRCVDCLACDGSARHITIPAHGPGAVHVTRRTLPVLS